MAILGNINIESSYSSPGWVHACKFILPEDGIISRISIYLSNYYGEALGDGEVRVGIYNDVGGEPSALLLVTARQNFNDEEQGWKDFMVNQFLPAGTYHLAFEGTNSNCIGRYGAGEVSQYHRGYGFADPFGTIDAVQDFTLSINATYTPTALGVNVEPESASLLVGDSQTFTANVHGGTPSYSVRWIDNATGTEIGTGESYVFSALMVGTFEIYAEVTDGEGTKANSAVVAILVTEPPTLYQLSIDSTPIRGIPFTIERVS